MRPQRLRLSERAAGAAANGQRLSESELDFLEALLHGTDDVLLDLHNDGLRGDPSTPQQQEIAAMLGMSIVALSHTSAGGGHDRLPESIRTVSNGVREGTGYFLGGPGNSNAGYGKWLEDAEGLTYLLDQARHPNGTPIQLGEETSLKITAAVSEVAGAIPSEHNRYDTSITYRPDEGEQTTMSRLLGFSTANEDANHTLLTNASEPNGRDAEQILTDLYTFDWNDDGRAVSGLTDWIANGETSADPQEPDRSREALVGLMDIVSSEIMQEKLEQTGQEVDDTMTVMDAEGETSTEEFSWKDVSIGHLNPELAGGVSLTSLTRISMYSPV